MSREGPGKVKVRSRQDQGNVKARSWRGQGNVKIKSRQCKHSLDRNYNLMGVDKFKINLVLYSLIELRQLGVKI